MALLLMIIIFLLMHNIDKASGFSFHWRVTTILSVIWLEVDCYYYSVPGMSAVFWVRKVGGSVGGEVSEETPLLLLISTLSWLPAC